MCASPTIELAPPSDPRYTTIQGTYPKATYIHCAAYTLNPCVVAACTIPAIHYTHGILQEVYIYYS